MRHTKTPRICRQSRIRETLTKDQKKADLEHCTPDLQREPKRAPPCAAVTHEEGPNQENRNPLTNPKKPTFTTDSAATTSRLHQRTKEAPDPTAVPSPEKPRTPEHPAYREKGQRGGKGKKENGERGKRGTLRRRRRRRHTHTGG